MILSVGDPRRDKVGLGTVVAVSAGLTGGGLSVDLAANWLVFLPAVGVGTAVPVLAVGAKTLLIVNEPVFIQRFLSNCCASI